MAPGGKPSCLTTLPAVRHCQSQCEPTDSQTHSGVLKEFDYGTLDSRRMDMDMVRPRKDPWGLSPVGGPWEAWGSLMDLCGRSRPVGPPRSSCVAYVGRVCHCHCGGDRSSRHPVRLVWVNGSLGCRTIAARTRDLILDTIHVLRAYTASYLSYCESQTEVRM